MPKPKAEPLAIGPILGEAKNRIARMGVELEGGWDSLPKGTELEHDGSVYRNERKVNILYGELPIGPVLPAAIPRGIRKYHPHHVNHTCGLHVHMSFQTLRYYMWLMEPEFPVTMIEYLKQWAKAEGFPKEHHIWERFEGKSEFCQDEFWPDLQVGVKKKSLDRKQAGHRYTMVHYCGRYNTIEIRVLPMMETAAQSIRAVQQVKNITNACLVMLAEKDSQLKSRLEVSESEVEIDSSESEIPLTQAQRRRLK